MPFQRLRELWRRSVKELHLSLTIILDASRGFLRPLNAYLSRSRRINYIAHHHLFERGIFSYLLPHLLPPVTLRLWLTPCLNRRRGVSSRFGLSLPPIPLERDWAVRDPHPREMKFGILPLLKVSCCVHHHRHHHYGFLHHHFIIIFQHSWANRGVPNVIYVVATSFEWWSFKHRPAAS